MLRGLWKLTWLEIKIFVREPLGVIGTVGDPGAALRRARPAARPARARRRPTRRASSPPTCRSSSSLLIADQRRAVAGDDHLDLPRGRHPQAAARHAAAAAHHPDRARLVKLLLTAVTLAADGAGRPALLPGRRRRAAGLVRRRRAVQHASASSSLGFVIASLVPTARFAQPIGALILYPMLGLSGTVRAGRVAAAGCCRPSRACCR